MTLTLNVSHVIVQIANCDSWTGVYANDCNKIMMKINFPQLSVVDTNYAQYFEYDKLF